jgi:hypothetical protein
MVDIKKKWESLPHRVWKRRLTLVEQMQAGKNKWS